MSSFPASARSKEVFPELGGPRSKVILKEAAESSERRTLHSNLPFSNYKLINFDRMYLMLRIIWTIIDGKIYQNLLRATSYTRLRVCDHCTSSTLVVKWWSWVISHP